MFREEDIMTAQDFNEIEHRIYEITNRLSDIGYTIDEYDEKTWESWDNLLESYLNNIETGIKNIGDNYFKPYGWQNTKEWQPLMSFSYQDVNRWINNLDLIEEELEKQPERTIWNNQSFTDWGTYETDLEWEE